MIYLIATAVVVFVLYISYGTLFYGTRNSLSQLGLDWNRWLFMLMIWTITLLVLPKMFGMTPDNLQFLVFIIGAGLLLTGGASIADSDDAKYHMAGAVIACLGAVVWLGFIQPIVLMVPLVTVASGDIDRWQWNVEVGIIIAVLLTLLL